MLIGIVELAHDQYIKEMFNWEHETSMMFIINIRARFVKLGVVFGFKPTIPLPYEDEAPSATFGFQTHVPLPYEDKAHVRTRRGVKDFSYNSIENIFSSRYYLL